MKLAIVGTRNPGVSYQEWEKFLLGKINPDEIQMIISGGAKGVDIVREASTVVAFPSAESRGTNHSIKEAQRFGRRVIVVNL